MCASAHYDPRKWWRNKRRPIYNYSHSEYFYFFYFYSRSKFKGISRAQMFTFSGIQVAYCSMSSLRLLAHRLDATAHHHHHTIIHDSMRLNEANRLHWLDRPRLRNINMQFEYCEFSYGKVFEAGPNIDITNSFTKMVCIEIIRVHPEFSPSL